jgi:hypothetical protein
VLLSSRFSINLAHSKILLSGAPHLSSTTNLASVQRHIPEADLKLGTKYTRPTFIDQANKNFRCNVDSL